MFDKLITANNERGVFSCSTFKDDEHRFMIATIAEKSMCNVQIRDYTFDRDYQIENVFGEADEV